MQMQMQNVHNYYMHISKNHLVPNAKIFSYYFICHCLMPYHSVVDASTPSIAFIDSMRFSFNRIMSRCQDMNRLETQNWIRYTRGKYWNNE